MRRLRDVAGAVNVHRLAVVGVVGNNHVTGNVACNGSRSVGSAQVNSAHAGARTPFKVLRCGAVAEVQHNKAADRSQRRMNGIGAGYAQRGHVVLKKQLFRACTITVFDLLRHAFHYGIVGFRRTVVGGDGEVERRIEVMCLRRVRTDCGVRRERYLGRYGTQIIKRAERYGFIVLVYNARDVARRDCKGVDSTLVRPRHLARDGYLLLFTIGIGVGKLIFLRQVEHR